MRVAIVDDDPAFREALEGLLAALGYGCAAFDSTESFLAWADRQSVSCLLLDMQMPGLGGLELQARLVAAGEGLPIIFISSRDDGAAQARAMAAGALACLGKPFDRDRLLSLLAQVRDGRTAGPA